MKSTVVSSARELLGTDIALTAPLMSAGLDSIAATEFSRTLSCRLQCDLSPTLLFDHPTLDSLSSFLVSFVQDPPGGDENAGVGEVERSHEVALGLPPRTPTLLPAESVRLAALNFQLPSGLEKPEGEELRHLVSRKQSTLSSIPAARWLTQSVGVAASATYGSFV